MMLLFFTLSVDFHLNRYTLWTPEAASPLDADAGEKGGVESGDFHLALNKPTSYAAEAVDAAAEPDAREILATSESVVCVSRETAVDGIRLLQFQR